MQVARSDHLVNIVFSSCNSDAKSAAFKENVMVQLSQLQEATASGLDAVCPLYGDIIQSGDIKSLARTLHDILRVRLSIRTRPSGTTRLDNTSKLQIMIICSVIEHMLCKSPKMTVVEYKDGLGACLPRVMVMFAHGSGYSTIRLFTIANCIRIMLSLPKSCPQTADRFIESLLVLYDCDCLVVPCDILVDASRAIARFSTETKNASALANVEQKIDTLISTLVVAVSSKDRCRIVAALESLRDLAHVSSFASYMADHCVLVRATCRHLSSHSARVRKAATAMIGMWIANYILLQRDQESRRNRNLELVVNALTNAVLKEVKAKLQKCMLSNLLELLNKEGLESNILPIAMKSMLTFALSGNLTEEVAVKSAIAYLQAARKCEYNADVLLTVVDFTKSTFAKVRKHALQLLYEITFWNLSAPQTLLRKTIVLEWFAFILDQGSDKDSVEVLKICHHLLFEKANEYLFLQSSNMVLALVSLVTQDIIVNRVVYVSAVNIVLSAMEDDNNFSHFLHYSHLLPWIIKTSNRTTDESLKERLVRIIVRFSAALLKNNV